MQDVEKFLRHVIEPNGLALSVGFHSSDDFLDCMKYNGERYSPTTKQRLSMKCQASALTFAKNKMQAYTRWH